MNDITYFINKDYKIIKGPNWFIVVPKQKELNKEENKYYQHSNSDKICKICNSIFRFGPNRRIVCICKLFVKCNYCGKYFESLKTKEFINYIANKDIINISCSNECRIKNLNKNWENNYEKMKHNSINNLYKAREKKEILKEQDSNYSKKEKEIALNALIYARLYWEKHPKEQRKHLTKQSRRLAKEIKNNTEFGKNLKDIRANNGMKTINLAKRARLENIKKSILKLDIKIDENLIDVLKIFELRKNDICGAYAIKAKFKNYKGTNKENKIYKLLVCKSKYIYNEIYWVLRILSQPEKQDRNENWTIAKWWYISNLYYNFEFILLTDPDGVSEEEALLIEAKYALSNNMFVEFEENKKPIIEKHAYFSL